MEKILYKCYNCNQTFLEDEISSTDHCPCCSGNNTLLEYEIWWQCQWCGEYFPSDGMKVEVDLGALCDRCAQAIQSRGEKLHFMDDDMLDE